MSRNGEVDEECEYCWKRSTRERYLQDDGRYAYCKDHAPADATRIRRDTDGYRIKMEEEEREKAAQK